ncbi:hypothetical protein FBY03_1301 [Pseudomonas sp. SJZ079]|uniref:hypothetical protein n=1 Tax=Pseudomonas sp. SJZ079 TaxID=2572887 RepID=UPI00119A3DE9|nr:hypothetical protein [Pseudomonas sp. SJZ079]TWC29222.1 hypothetical protein FBY03_1301 [Pseudomonas sp. SJZ079]
MCHWRLFCCLLCAAPLRAAEIILSSADDNPTLRAFSVALAQRRPQDLVRFQPLAQLQRADKLPPHARLVLFGAKALEWRLTRPAGPATLVYPLPAYTPTRALAIELADDAMLARQIAQGETP